MATYVMSDVHGLKEKYDRMIQELPLRDEDELYVLGDVIDRGNDGIDILLDIMERKNVHMVLGNHEYMMIQYYQAEMEGKFELYDKLVIEERWQRNRGDVTKAKFNRLPRKKQLQVLDYLKSLPLAYESLMVNGQCYYLVHGHPVPLLHKEIVTMEDLKDTTLKVDYFIWDRVYDKAAFFTDRCVVFGHTPTFYLQDDHPYKIWTDCDDIKDAKMINIDCGCAANNKACALAVLCLDDRSVRYF